MPDKMKSKAKSISMKRKENIMKNERTVKKLLLAAIAFATCICVIVAAGCSTATTRSADGGLLESCAACAAMCAGCTCLTCSALACAGSEGYVAAASTFNSIYFN